MPSDDITSIVKETVVPPTFPKERGEEKAYFARRGFRSVVRYVFLETRHHNTNMQTYAATECLNLNPTSATIARLQYGTRKPSEVSEKRSTTSRAATLQRTNLESRSSLYIMINPHSANYIVSQPRKRRLRILTRKS